MKEKKDNEIDESKYLSVKEKIFQSIQMLIVLSVGMFGGYYFFCWVGVCEYSISRIYLLMFLIFGSVIGFLIGPVNRERRGSFGYTPPAQYHPPDSWNDLYK